VFQPDADAASPVRVVLQDGEPWFIAVDVCRILGIKQHRRAMMRLHDTQRGFLLVNTLGGPQQLGAVSEGGLYVLIFTSRKPVAVKFQLWVTSEVLPAIRKSGRYIAPAARQPEQPDHAPIQEGYLHDHDLRSSGS